MRQMAYILLAIGILALAACTSLALQTATPGPDEPVSPPASVEPSPGGIVTSTPTTPNQEDSSLSRGEVFVDSAQLIILESYPLQIKLAVAGNLPTPCHQLRSKVNAPDDQNRITVELYSLVDPLEICIQVLQSFETEIDLGSYPDGTYTVWLNETPVGEFTQ